MIPDRTLFESLLELQRALANITPLLQKFIWVGCTCLLCKPVDRNDNIKRFYSKAVIFPSLCGHGSSTRLMELLKILCIWNPPIFLGLTLFDYCDSTNFYPCNVPATNFDVLCTSFHMLEIHSTN